jgi:hypothetical protein
MNNCVSTLQNGRDGNSCSMVIASCTFRCEMEKDTKTDEICTAPPLCFFIQTNCRFLRRLQTNYVLNTPNVSEAEGRKNYITRNFKRDTLNTFSV